MWRVESSSSDGAALLGSGAAVSSLKTSVIWPNVTTSPWRRTWSLTSLPFTVMRDAGE
jgi:hypothetical protein